MGSVVLFLAGLLVGSVRGCNVQIGLCSVAGQSHMPTGKGFVLLELQGQCHEIFCFRFFDESSSPKPLKITGGLFQIFSKIRGDIRISAMTICTTHTREYTIVQCLRAQKCIGTSYIDKFRREEKKNSRQKVFLFCIE